MEIRKWLGVARGLEDVEKLVMEPDLFRALLSTREGRVLKRM